MSSSCSGGLLGAVLYNPAQVQASVCCGVGNSHSPYGGWMQLCHATGSGWLPRVYLLLPILFAHTSCMPAVLAGDTSN